MKIVSLEYLRLDMPLTMPYTIAYETIDKTSNIILKINTDTGLSGWGCAAPDREVTGECAEDVTNNIKQLESVLIGEDPFQISRFNILLKKLLPGMSSTLAMVDIALFDLLARKAKIPLYKLLGGYRNSMQTSITIGILPLKETLEQTGYFLSRGFSILKLKGGISLLEDIEKIHRIREKYGNEFKLRFDANQGYSSSEAIDFIKKAGSGNIEILEQPTSLHNEEKLGMVKEGVNVPVMADESIKTLKDAYRLASNDIIDMVNIKLMKVGGILESQHINSVSKAAGIEVMVGCIDECALGISAGLHFALSRPNVEFADLDGHFDLLEDPFTNLLTLKNGELFPSASPGLGKMPDIF